MATQPYNALCDNPCIWVDIGITSKHGCNHADWCPKYKARERTTYNKKHNTTH